MRYIFIVSGLFFLTACSSPKKAILQNWKVDDVVFADSLNTFTESQKNAIIRKLKNEAQFSFLPDSNYQVISGSETTNGKWWFSADKKTLFTTTQQKTIQSKILELKKRIFRFESAGDLNQSVLFSCSPVVTDKK